MSAQTEVAPSPDGSDGAGGPLRVRPPSPLTTQRRIVVGVLAVLVLVIGVVLVLRARSADGGEVPGAAWRKLPVPRAAEVDDFGRDGTLDAPPGFGGWRSDGAPFVASGGVLRSGDGFATATVDAGTPDVLVHVRVVQAAPGGGVLVSSSAVGVPALALRATGPDRWDLVWERSGPPPQVLQTFAAPTAGASVQIIRRGDQVKVAFDDRIYVVDVPAETAGGTFVGLTSDGPGNEIDLFGYLPLAAA
ncbi:MAG: hypothetical protein JWO77_3686 [Ilumatobacteraceae bacterium]|nr:hypothetical protein [Ilumatobacteraceae bacterium]